MANARAKAVVIGAQLQPGHRYRVMHGGTFECIAVSEQGAAQLRSITSGATFIAEEITLYDDGTISWCKSRDLHYSRETKA